MLAAARILLTVLLLSGAAQAQVAKVSAKYCYRTHCTIGEGSCVNIGFHEGRAYFLTAGHVVTEPGAASVSARINLDNGLCEARIEAVDKDPDLALLSIPERDGTQVFELAEKLDGDSFDLVGFANGGRYVKRAAVRVRRSGDHAVFRSRVVTGDSGGPYLDSSGRVAAICWAASLAGDEGYATDCVRIRTWLKARAGFIPVPRRTGPPGKPLPEPQPTPAPHKACNCPDCAAKFADLQKQIDALKAKCDTPSPAPEKPDLSEIERRLKELEERAKALAELQGRMDEIKFEIDKVRIAGGKTDQLEKELAAIRDMTFQVRSLAPDGTVISSQRRKLGEDIDLRLVPKKPAT